EGETEERDIETQIPRKRRHAARAHHLEPAEQVGNDERKALRHGCGNASPGRTIAESKHGRGGRDDDRRKQALTSEQPENGQRGQHVDDGACANRGAAAGMLLLDRQRSAGGGEIGNASVDRREGRIDHQLAPRVVSSVGIVRSTINTSDHRLQLRMYSRSMRTTSSQASTSLRPAACQGPVRPGTTNRRSKCCEEYCSISWGSGGRGPTRLMSPRRTLQSCGSSSSEV